MSGGSNLRGLLVAIIGLMIVGLGAAGYVLVKQRFPVPFRDVYTVKAVLSSADGVAPGFGQAVNVSGVKVGTITEARIEGRRAHVEFEIDRDQLPEVYRDARVDLRPITPLKDMLVELDPGTRKAGVLPETQEIGLSATTAPVPLGDLLSTLDSDTRGFLTSLAAGLGEGTKDRGPDIRRLLRALGPTAEQLGDVTRSLDARRRELARLVSNIAKVTEAAESDGRLADLVTAGRRTLATVARQDADLRRGLRELPSTVTVADRALTSTGRLADVLGPAAKDLTPPVRDLTGTLKALRPLTVDFDRALRTEVRPLLKELQPVAREIEPLVTNLRTVLPDVSRVLQVSTYVANTLAYNPPGRDEGMLYWIAWAFHNFSSATSTADAHGSLFRAIIMLNCNQLTTLVDLGPLIKTLTGSAAICPS
ncbi:MAG: MlaD family protein [Solirubrobacteraceae bacterium]|nr:MlaD family protein [Solirubrobacteraceae bacterium]